MAEITNVAEPNELILEIQNNYSKWLIKNPQNPTYAIHLTDTKSKNIKDLRFKLTNSLFNKMHKENKVIETYYLFIIEYPERISRGHKDLIDCDPHAHIVINTTLHENTLKWYFNTIFRGSNVLIENTTKRTDKPLFIDYMLKQFKDNKLLLTWDNFNFKMD